MCVTSTAVSGQAVKIIRWSIFRMTVFDFFFISLILETALQLKPLNSFVILINFIGLLIRRSFHSPTNATSSMWTLSTQCMTHSIFLNYTLEFSLDSFHFISHNSHKLCRLISKSHYKHINCTHQENLGEKMREIRFGNQFYCEARS